MEERAEEIIQNAAERKGKKNIRKNLRGMEDVTKKTYNLSNQNPRREV